MEALRENYLIVEILYRVYLKCFSPASLNTKVSHQGWGLHGGRAYAHAHGKKAALDSQQFVTEMDETDKKLA